MVNGPGTDNDGSLAIKVPAADGQMRFWRNTAVASLPANATYTLPEGTLGYEWDEDLDNGSRPPGAFELSTVTYSLTSDLLLDAGGTYGAGTATHHLIMYRAPSGALVFGSGTIQWSWGLNSQHDNPFGFDNPNPDVNMEQATINLFADMGVQPATIQAGLQAATRSTDTIAPISTISSLASRCQYRHRRSDNYLWYCHRPRRGCCCRGGGVDGWRPNLASGNWPRKLDVFVGTANGGHDSADEPRCR